MARQPKHLESPPNAGQTERKPGRSVARGTTMTMTSTEAQNGFGRLLDAVAKDSTVLIKKHNVTQAVVMSVDRYNQLTRAQAPTLDSLTAEFDALLAAMQTPEARAGIYAGLSATPAELGEAALAAGRRELRS